MREAYLLIIGFLSAGSLFCAEQANPSSHLKSDGMFFIESSRFSYEDVVKMIHITNLIKNNKMNALAKQIYVQDLMMIPTAFETIHSLLLDVVDRNPQCAEHMLNEFISKEKKPFLFAFFSVWTGETYCKQHRHNDAVRLFTTSLEIIPNASAMCGMAKVYLGKNHLHGAAYWCAQHTKMGFDKTHFELGAFEEMCAMANEQNDQKTLEQLKKKDKNKVLMYAYEKSDFKKDINTILENEERDDYNPAILTARLAVEADDVWRDLR